MNDETLRMYLRAINEKLNIVIEQQSALARVIANHLDLPIVEGECDIDET